MRIVAYAALFLLTACSTPIPTPLPIPAPDPPVYAADFTNLTVGLSCTEESPPVCQGNAEWLTFDRPGEQGQDCVLPSPNPCWETEGANLRLHTGSPGFPLFTNRTFDRSRKITVEAVISAECKTPYCYVGPVLYNGESNYAAVYLAWAPDNRIQVYLYRTMAAVPLGSETYPAGTTLTLGIVYEDGSLTYTVNGVAKLTEVQGALIGPDSSVLANDPHLSVFIGDATASLQRLSVYGPS